MKDFKGAADRPSVKVPDAGFSRVKPATVLAMLWFSEEKAKTEGFNIYAVMPYAREGEPAFYRANLTPDYMSPTIAENLMKDGYRKASGWIIGEMIPVVENNGRESRVTSAGADLCGKFGYEPTVESLMARVQEAEPWPEPQRRAPGFLPRREP